MGLIAPKLADHRVQPMAVAVTASYSQMAFADALGVEFPMLSDWDGAVCEAYGVRYETWKGHIGLAKRALFVIDRDRIVRYRWSTEDAAVIPDLTDAVAVATRIGGGHAP